MNSTSNRLHDKIAHLAEWLLVFFGAVVCMAAAAIFGSQTSQPIWPAPGLYFVELTLLAILAAVSQLADRLPAASTKLASWQLTKIIPWICGGILLTFVILGGFSIGPFLSPAMVAFFLAGFISDWRSKSRMTGHISIAVMAAVLQGALIVMINLFVIPSL